MSNETADRRKFLRIVMIAVLVWGSLLAIGATLFGLDRATGEIRFSPNLVRGLIVEACVLGFLSIWFLALSRRAST